MQPLINDNLAKLIKKAKETAHVDVEEGVKKRSLAELNVNSDAVKWLLSLKNGPLTSITLALDGEEDSDCQFQLRLLTAQEEADVEGEMMELMNKHDMMPLSLGYNIYKISKILSRASKPIASNMNFVSPTLTEQELRDVLPTELLIALGERYNEFRIKHVPDLDEVTQEDINEILDALEKCENDPKKLLSTFSTLKYFTMLKTAVQIYLKMADSSSELAKLYTG